MSNSIIIKELISNYKSWIRANPDLATNYETAFKWGAYFLAQRMNNSMIQTEVVYAASNLLVFLNDRIIQTGLPASYGPSYKVKSWLSVLEYLEVVLEISANHSWGSKAKWLVICAIQLLKCSLRLKLLLKFNEHLVSTPAFLPLKRFQSEPKPSSSNASAVAFTLKRSRRVIRKVEASPVNGARLWKPPVVNEEDENDEKLDADALSKQLTAEVLYIVKPLIHIASTYRCGEQSWKPWLLSLGVDLASIILIRSNKRLHRTKEQEQEISRRMLQLLLYILRSPYYDRHSKDRIDAFLDALSRIVPFARHVCQPLKLYIPYFQTTYSYAWST